MPNTIDLDSLVVRPIYKEERNSWDQLMATHHYLGFRHLVGESVRYVAILNGQWVAILGWSSASFQSASRDQWIGWSAEQRLQRLKFVVNNSRFLILPGCRIKNLASKTLALNLKRLPEDWLKAYGHPVWLAETFIDHSRFSGTCYRAAGFIPLGQTRGFGRNAGRYFVHGKAKTILVRPLHQNVGQWLTAPFLSPSLLVGRELPALLDLNKLAIDELPERILVLRDSRLRRGIRHRQTTILTVAVCAILSGFSSYMDLGRFAAILPQNILRQLGCQRGSNKRGFVPPSEATLRRAIQGVDIADLCQTVAGWLSTQGQERVAPVVSERLQALRQRSLREGNTHAS